MYQEQDLYADLAVAYVLGSHPDLSAVPRADVLALGRERGLKLHRFKRTGGLPRVKAVIGALRGIAPNSLLDIGSGRGVFLWPLLDAFPTLDVIAVEPDARRQKYLQAVSDGGYERLVVLADTAERLSPDMYRADVVTVLEVLEHQQDPTLLARAAISLAGRFVIATVPSKEDDNPEHIHLFDGHSLKKLLLDAGAISANISYVPNHIVGVAQVA